MKQLRRQRSELPAASHYWCVVFCPPGGKMYLIYNRVLDGGSFSIYKGTAEDDNVVIKVKQWTEFIYLGFSSVQVEMIQVTHRCIV